MFLTTIFIQFLALSCAMAADDWVLLVPKGIDTASKVAKLHHLDNLGEVIPGKEIYIFRLSTTSYIVVVVLQQSFSLKSTKASKNHLEVIRQIRYIVIIRHLSGSRSAIARLLSSGRIFFSFIAHTMGLMGLFHI